MAWCFNESDGLPGINSVMVCPLLQSQSSVNGLFRFANKLLDVSYASHATNFFRRIQPAVSNVTIDDVDTIQTPAEFMKPANASQVMENFVHMGSSAHPLELRMSLLLAMAGSIIPITHHWMNYWLMLDLTQCKSRLMWRLGWHQHHSQHWQSTPNKHTQKSWRCLLLVDDQQLIVVTVAVFVVAVGCCCCCCRCRCFCYHCCCLRRRCHSFFTAAAVLSIAVAVFLSLSLSLSFHRCRCCYLFIAVAVLSFLSLSFVAVAVAVAVPVFSLLWLVSFSNCPSLSSLSIAFNCICHCWCCNHHQHPSYVRA